MSKAKQSTSGNGCSSRRLEEWNMSVTYHCPHLASPHPPFPPSYPSSSSSQSPLASLYFCEECDAVRCNQCVAVEVASYFCPNCLFDVPSANVRADKNRCARSCFACPQCPSALQVTATDTIDPSSSASVAGPPYYLKCPHCKWNSKAIGWEFEKSTGLALQVQKMQAAADTAQAEFDALKDHLDSYLAVNEPPPPPVHRSALAKHPTRHISQLTQMAAKALGRDVPGMNRVRPRKSEADGRDKRFDSWDELGAYAVKGSWKAQGLARGMQDVEDMKNMQTLDVADLSRRWDHSWDRDTNIRSTLPERIPLITKLTKRCPYSACRHLLIQPDTKSVRFKIKMVARTYLPEVEVGRRRRRLHSGDLEQSVLPEEIERRRRERRKTRGRAEEEGEEMSEALRPGQIYSFQLAFTNPLYDMIQIRLTQPPPPKGAPKANHHLHIPTQHFTVAALKDAWYEDEEDEDELMPSVEGSEGTSEKGSSGAGTLGRSSRKSLLATSSLREKKRGEAGVEKKGNISFVGIEVEVLPDAMGPVEFDLEVRYKYRAEDAPEKEEGKEVEKGKEEYKTFTFWVRVHVGTVAM